MKVDFTHLWFLLLTSYDTIHIQIERFFNSLTESFTEMTKRKRSLYLLSKITRYKNGRTPQQSQNIKSVGHPHIIIEQN